MPIRYIIFIIAISWMMDDLKVENVIDVFLDITQSVFVSSTHDALVKIYYSNSIILLVVCLIVSTIPVTVHLFKAQYKGYCKLIYHHRMK